MSELACRKQNSNLKSIYYAAQFVVRSPRWERTTDAEYFEAVILSKCVRKTRLQFENMFDTTPLTALAPATFPAWKSCPKK